MSETPFEPDPNPEADPTDNPDIVPSSDPDGGSTPIPPHEGGGTDES